MDKQAIIEELINIMGDYLKSKGLDLVDLIYRYEGRDLFLKILTDKPEGGITLDECGRVNKDIGGILDERGTIPGKYTLEVSSPGIDRSLETRNDFARCKNKKIKLFLSEAVNGRLEIDGVIKGVFEDSVSVETKERVADILLSKINKAKQII